MGGAREYKNPNTQSIAVSTFTKENVRFVKTVNKSANLLVSPHSSHPLGFLEDFQSQLQKLGSPFH